MTCGTFTRTEAEERTAITRRGSGVLGVAEASAPHSTATEPPVAINHATGNLPKWRLSRFQDLGGDPKSPARRPQPQRRPDRPASLAASGTTQSTRKME